MFKNNINIKSSGYQHYLCSISPREVMNKFLNVAVDINSTKGTCDQTMKEFKV